MTDSRVQKRLCDIAPREQSGANTGALYEYQYQQAAAACLGLLEDQGHECVFCEWHDDFVIEFAATIYGFHQVKTRTSSSGPWTIGDVFGVPFAGHVPKKPTTEKNKKTSNPPKTDSIVPKMLAHYLNFGASCGRVVLVTNVNIQPAFEQLLSDVKSVSSANNLQGDSAVIFNQLLNSYELLPITKELFLIF